MESLTDFQKLMRAIDIAQEEVCDDMYIVKVVIEAYEDESKSCYIHFHLKETLNTDEIAAIGKAFDDPHPYASSSDIKDAYTISVYNSAHIELSTDTNIEISVPEVVHGKVSPLLK